MKQFLPTLSRRRGGEELRPEDKKIIPYLLHFFLTNAIFKKKW